MTLTSFLKKSCAQFAELGLHCLKFVPAQPQQMSFIMAEVLNLKLS